MTALSDFTKYGAQSAKVRVMSRRLLKKEDYLALSKKRTVSEAALFLKTETSYSEVLANIETGAMHRGTLEALLSRSYAKDFVKLCRFSGDKNKEFFDVFYLKYEIDLIKNILRQLVNEKSVSQHAAIPPSLAKKLTINIDALEKSENIYDFLKNLTGSRFEKLVKPLISIKTHHSIFDVEMALDMYLFKMNLLLCRTLKKSDRKLIEELLGSEIDILNLMWIYRAKKYFHIPPEFIYPYIIPNNYKLKQEEIIALSSAQNTDEFLALSEKTAYKDVFREIMNDYTDRGYTKYIYRLYKKLSVKNPFSILSVMSYLEFKSIEIGNITSIIEGIRYGLPSAEIMKYVAEGVDL